MIGQITTWIIEPRDPLLVRDGRPFGPDPGARATSLPFPFPSTLAGGIRTRAGVNEEGIFQYTSADTAALQHLKKLRIRGPLLVELALDGGDIERDAWFVPAPHDALLLQLSGQEAGEVAAPIQRLVSLERPPGAQTDLDQQELLLVGQSRVDELKKPQPGAPAYWSWENFKIWLLNPSGFAAEARPVSQLGLPHLVREQRLHVSIATDSETAKDGMLFETSGLEFTAPGAGKQRLRKARRLALAIVAEDSDYSIRSGLAALGGERRLVTWRKSSVALPDCPAELAAAIITARRCRVFLLTPACFTQGYRPTWLQEEAAKYGVQIELEAIAVQRPQVVSGWDIARGKPKPSRRLAPAGTVLFLSMKGTETALREWIDRTWMQCISDKDEDRADGFGLAVLGWSERPAFMEKGQAQ